MWPTFSGVHLAVEGKHRKTSTRKLNPAGNQTRARCVRSNDVTSRSQRCAHVHSYPVLFFHNERVVNISRFKYLFVAPSLIKRYKSGILFQSVLCPPIYYEKLMFWYPWRLLCVIYSCIFVLQHLNAPKPLKIAFEFPLQVALV